MAQQKLRFAIGPFHEKPAETRAAFEPFFKHLAEQVRAEHTFTVASDWAALGAGLAAGQYDLAWMGTWSYVKTRGESGIEALATVLYEDQASHHAVIFARADLSFATWPEDGKGLRLLLADRASITGWLMPVHWLRSLGVDPKTHFQLTEGAPEAGQLVALLHGRADLGAGAERQLARLVASGLADPARIRILWRSAPLPNDALVARKGLDPILATGLRDAAIATSSKAAPGILPPPYTGWAIADPAGYGQVEEAAIALGRLGKRRTAER